MQLLLSLFCLITVQKDTQRDQCLDMDRKADAVKAIAMQEGFLTDEVSPLYKA